MPMISLHVKGKTTIDPEYNLTDADMVNILSYFGGIELSVKDYSLLNFDDQLPRDLFIGPEGEDYIALATRRTYWNYIEEKSLDCITSMRLPEGISIDVDTVLTAYNPSVGGLEYELSLYVFPEKLNFESLSVLNNRFEPASLAWREEVTQWVKHLIFVYLHERLDLDPNYDKDTFYKTLVHMVMKERCWDEVSSRKFVQARFVRAQRLVKNSFYCIGQELYGDNFGKEDLIC
jgi:hypothetical protein